MEVHRRDTDNEATEEAGTDLLVNENREAIPQTKQEDDESNLRDWLKLCFSAAFRWKDCTCTIQIIYFIIFWFQVAKALSVTAQICTHGHDRAWFDKVVNRGQLTLKHLLLENWNANRETPPYPPSQGEFAVYTLDSLESSINYAVSSYYNAETDSIGFFKRIDTDSMKATMKHFDFPGFQDADVDKGITISEKHFAINHGLTKDDETKYSYSIAKELQYLNFSQPMKRMLTTTLEFTIHSVRPHEETRQALCLRINGKVLFSDEEDNGQVVVKLKTVTSKIRCGAMHLSIDDFNLGDTSKPHRDIVTTLCGFSIFCTVSFGLAISCVIGLNSNKFKKEENKCKRFLYHIFWEILLLVSDSCTIAGIRDISSDTQRSELKLSHLDSHAISLGIGCFLTWFGFLRYFRVHNRFLLLFRTVFRAIPDVLAYLLCNAVLFTGFWICGYIVLGPYHIKFQTPDAAAWTLFAIANGDEIYATLAMFEKDQTGSKDIWWFAHVYIGVYVTVYAIVVINLLIALFMTAYEEIKTKSKGGSNDQMEEAIEAFKNKRNVKTQRSTLYKLLRSIKEKSEPEKTLENELKKDEENVRDEETKTYSHRFCTPHVSWFCKRKKGGSNDQMELAIEASKNERNVNTRRSTMYKLLRSINEKSDAEKTLETELERIVETVRDEEIKTYCHGLCIPHVSLFCIKNEKKREKSEL